MAGVQTIVQQTAAALVLAKSAAITNLVTALGTYNLISTNYTTVDFALITGFKTAGDTAINAAIDTAGVTSAQNTATAGMAGVQTIINTPTPITPSAPSVTVNDTANTVSGMAVGMEYSLDGAIYAAYDSAIFSVINFSGPHTLLVRIAAVGSNPFGPDTTLTFTTNITPDMQAPVITLNGVDPINLIVGSTFIDPGATAIDNVDTIVTVASTGTVDTATMGTYTITYNASDVAGNVAISVTRTVNVNITPVVPTPDIIAPVITLNGNNPIDLFIGDTFTDPGASALDAVDGSVIATATGSVDTTIVGVNTITYTATDVANNVSTLTRTINVNAVIPVTLSSIVIVNPANKLIYIVGDTLNISGLVVGGTYSDSSTKNETVTLINISGFDSSFAAAQQILTISLNGITTSYSVTINSVPNQDQLAPTGLVGIAPTSALNNGRILNTTSAMEYKLSTDVNYISVISAEITGLIAGNYNVRFAATAGFNAGADAVVTVPTYVAPVVITAHNNVVSVGGGSYTPTACSSVSYGEWGTTFNGIQFRNVLNQTPNNCSLTASQKVGQSRPVISQTVEPIVSEISPVVAQTQAPVQQVLGEKKYANGTLLQGSNGKIYVVSNNKLRYISALKELAKYKGRVLKVDDSTIISFAKTTVLGVKKYANGTLLKAKGDSKIYVIKDSKKMQVESLMEFKKYKGKILVVTASELNNY